MSFFGLFGSNDPEVNCECHKNLKEHLKKCAGYGQRPSLIDPKKCPPIPKECQEKKTDECGHDPAEGRVYLNPFIPDCKVPPTAKFTCPPGTCVEKPTECQCPPPPPSCDDKSNSSSSSSGRKSSEVTTCEPKPLKL